MDFSGLNATVLNTFGETITVAGTSVPAVYDSRHYESEDGEAGSSDLITTVTVKTELLPTIDDTTVIVARGISYKFFDVRPDSEGFTVLLLERRP